jgi:hypothetical protein
MKYVLEQKKAKGREAEARAAFSVGMELYGYCCGIFGRDSYDTKRILAIDDDRIICINSDARSISGNVYSWVELLESSNNFLIEKMETE